MSAFVLDASVAGRWLLARDLAPELAALRIAALVEGATVPTLFRFEAAHMFTRWARHRDDGSALKAAAELALLAPIEDPEPASCDELLALALESGLTAYDAAYLELAQRLELPLATVDSRLADAARLRGVAVLP